MAEHSYNHIPTAGFPIKAWTRGVPVEEAAISQLRNIAALPFIHHHIAVMPDVHHGKGATVGSVIATNRVIIPAAVGVDIGCGMIAQQTTLKASDLPDNLDRIRFEIERLVPHGRTANGGPGDRGAWGSEAEIDKRLQHLDLDPINQLFDKYPKLKGEWEPQRIASHLGTLGTGNHFVEVCLDETDTVWVMLHSGSRGIGNRIGTFFIELAKKDMRQWFINLPDDDLAYLPEGTTNFNDYVRAVSWAQKYASLNRTLMMEATLSAMRQTISKPFDSTPMAINCHHNYVAKEQHFDTSVWITRKGAVRAREGDLGIIPGSMGTRSYIVRGKGNPQSFHSCSHGAGRRMSRTEARRTFTQEDHIKAVQGISCRTDADVIDETPAAYKDIDAVMEAQKDLVDIIHTLRQIICVKG